MEQLEKYINFSTNKIFGQHMPVEENELELRMYLVSLDVLLSLGATPVGGVESDLELVDVLFEFLLHAHGLGLAAGLCLEARLHGVEGTLVVLAANENQEGVIRNSRIGTSVH